jgi:hypothetical protein
MVQRPLLLGALILAGLLGGAQPADAAPISIKKAIWGPVDAFATYAELGAGIYQTTVRWDQVAPGRPADPSNPADPAYRWPAEVDTAIAEGARYGIEVSVMILGAPRWANGGKAWRWAPKRPADFARFAAAASRRWPGVRHWMIWSEPTKAANWQPLAGDEGAPLRTRRQLRGPRLYARVLDASYAALKAVTPRNLVIGGNTFTVGTVAPLYWVQALKLPDGRPPRMDLWGHNPFSLRSPNLAHPPLGRGFADFSDLDTLANALDRAMRRARLPAQRHVRIFLSEYSLPTDHPNHEFNFHMSQQVQAVWIRKALRIVRGWKRIYTFGYLGLNDDPLRADGQQVERGLIQRDGRRKPAFAAYRDG